MIKITEDEYADLACEEAGIEVPKECISAKVKMPSYAKGNSAPLEDHLSQIGKVNRAIRAAGFQQEEDDDDEEESRKRKRIDVSVKKWVLC
jgi:hypothetical protein